MKKYELSIDNKALISVSLTVSGHFDIPGGIEAITWGTFGNCELLESINIPDSIKKSAIEHSDIVHHLSQ